MEFSWVDIYVYMFVFISVGLVELCALLESN